MLDLELIYRESLRRCEPGALVRRVVTPDMPRTIAAIGKCAAAMAEGIPDPAGVLAVVPKGYPGTNVIHGGHPQIDDDSFRAGEALLRFVDAHADITFLISGGGSACAEVPLAPFFTRDDVRLLNDRLIAAGLPIRDINTVRKHVSAIKGGRLAARVRGRSVSLVYSDVATGDLASVASGPTVPDASTKNEAIDILQRVSGCHRIVAALRNAEVPETVREIGNTEVVLVADNNTLVETAAELIRDAGLEPVRWPEQIESDVSTAARQLAERAAQLDRHEVLVAGGEPTVVVGGSGRGGRCSELAVRFALDWQANHHVRALFGSSDGVDGNSGAAGFLIDVPAAFDRGAAAAALESSDSASAASRIGRPIIMPPTGNNLRDLYLVARR
ncbi:MAG TPA: DUF4147 domain-containing protein [Thermoanaerobaculia bacterium]|nr:DUF4147 domain-containing protein [Thermoanaerobaculia bacterium]